METQEFERPSWLVSEKARFNLGLQRLRGSAMGPGALGEAGGRAYCWSQMTRWKRYLEKWTRRVCRGLHSSLPPWLREQER